VFLTYTFAAAALDFKGSLAHQYRNQSLSCIAFPVWYMNCHSPVAPIPETALGFSADSTTAKYFISNGTFSLQKLLQKRGK
jgi:hypothetical protein